MNSLVTLLWVFSRRTLPAILLLAVFLPSGLALAANFSPIGPQLQQQLMDAIPGKKIPVIVRMQESIDIGQYTVPTRRKGPARAEARTELVQALKGRAAQDRQPLQAVLNRLGIHQTRDLWLINGLSFEATADQIEAIAEIPEVASIAYDLVIEKPVISPAEITSPAQSNIDLINAPDVWDLGYTGLGVTVAIVDGGVDAAHPDLATPRWRGGTNSWYDPAGEHPTVPYDPDGHGTLAAGIVVGGDNSGKFIGVAPDAQWIAVKIFTDNGDSTASVVHDGFQWLLDPDDNPATDDAPDIASNSWGFESSPDRCTNFYRIFQPDVQALKAAGIAVVFSAGNTGPRQPSSVAPANYPESFAVGSVGTNSSETTISDFSARGPSACDGTVFPEVVAPGYLIRSSDIHDSYSYASGTSFAAPHASGVMALLLSAFPDAPVATIESALMHSSTDYGGDGEDTSYGHGLLNAVAALEYLHVQQAISITDSIVSETDHQVPFGSVELNHAATETVRVKNTGALPILLDPVDTSNVAAPFSVSSDGCSNQTLPPGASCSISIGFNPSTVGSYAGSLDIVSEVVGQEQTTVNLSGSSYFVGVKSMTVTDSISPSDDEQINFGQIVPNNSDSASIWVRNSGNVSLNIYAVGTSQFAAPFSIVNDACSGKTLLVGQTCAIAVEFAPVIAGTYAGSLTVTSDADQNSQVTIDLSGIGNHPPIAPTPLLPEDEGITGASVTFSWFPASDADADDTVNQYLIYDTNWGFTSPTTVQVDDVGVALLGAGGLLLGGLFYGVAQRRRKVAVILIIAGLLLGLAACGGGGGGGGGEETDGTGDGGDDGPVPPTAQSITIGDLIPGTTYYWKMVARDSRGAEDESAVQSFVVE